MLVAFLDGFLQFCCEFEEAVGVFLQIGLPILVHRLLALVLNLFFKRILGLLTAELGILPTDCKWIPSLSPRTTSEKNEGKKA